MRLPSSNKVSLSFNSAEPPYNTVNRHKGVDFEYVPDNRIYAPFTGNVILVPNNGNDGNGIYMYNGRDQFHGLLHTSQYLVPNGAFVQEGQVIGVMGSTGAAEGVHLHWCVKQNNVFIDPMSLISKETNMETITKEMEMVLSQLATPTQSNPGKDYSYPFVGKELTAKNVSEMLTAWRGRKVEVSPKELSPDQQTAIDSLKVLKHALELV